MMLYNTEIEKSVLGCIIIDNGLVDKCRLEIKDVYFSNPLLRKTYEEILEIYPHKGIADIATIKTIAVEDILEITNFVVTTANFNLYKAELIDLGIKREMLKAAESIKQNIMNSNETTSDALKMDILNTFNSIQVKSSCKEKTEIHDVMMLTIDRLEKKYLGIDSVNKLWGIKWLDEQTGGIKPELTYLAARPSIGKTALALQICRVAAKQGMNVAFFSLEMDSVSVTNRLICNDGNIIKDYFDKNIIIPKEIWIKICRTTAEVGSLPMNIFDKCFLIEDILLNCEELRAKGKLDFIIIDYIQLCETSQRYNNPNDRISIISRQLKKYQQQIGIPVLALSQFNRETELKKYPTLSSLRDSGCLEQDANNVFFLHDSEPDMSNEITDSKELQLIIAKQREGNRNIFCPLKFYGKTQRFYDGR